MDKESLSKFKIESLFQEFLSCFSGMTDDEDVIDLLRDFFYRGAGEIMAIVILSGKKAVDMQEMFNEVIDYDKMKESEFVAENN